MATFRRPHVNNVATYRLITWPRCVETLENIVSAGRARFLRADAFRAPKQMSSSLFVLSLRVSFSAPFFWHYFSVASALKKAGSETTSKQGILAHNRSWIRITRSCAKPLKRRAKFANENTDHLSGRLIFGYEATIKRRFLDFRTGNTTKIGTS